MAENPNASTETLDVLARTFPEVVGRNAILDWLLVENPDWLSHLSDISRRRILSTPGTPHGFAWWALNFGAREDKLAICANADTERAVVDRLLDDLEEDVSAAARSHVSVVTMQESRADDAIARALASASRDDAELLDLFTADALPEWLLPALTGEYSAPVKRALARHPRTLPSMLARLVVDDADDIAEAASAHPNAPSEIVSRWHRLCAGDVSLRADELASLALTEHARRAVAQHPNADKAFLLDAVDNADWRMREAVARNPTLGTSELVRLAADGDRDVRAAIAANPAVPRAVLEALRYDTDDRVRAMAEARDQPGEGGRSAILDESFVTELVALGEPGRRLAAIQPGLPADVLSQLAVDESVIVRVAVASNPAVSDEALARLAADAEGDVRVAVASNPRADRSILDALVIGDPVPAVRAAAARRGELSPALLSAPATDEDESVRAALAANPSAPDAVLVALARSGDRAIRLALATRADVSVAVLDELLADESGEVRAALLERTDLSDPALGRLLDFTGETPASPGVFRRSALPDGAVSADEIRPLLTVGDWMHSLLVRRPGLDSGALALLSVSDDWRVRHGVAGHPRADRGLLERLAGDSDYDVRSAVAAHPATPHAVLTALAADSSAQVRRALARRADTPVNLLELLAIDEDDDVRAETRANPRLPVWSRELLDALRSGRYLESEAIARLANGPAFARREVARHPLADGVTLQRLAEDGDWHVREAVAAHRAAFPGTLAALAMDNDVDVRRAAACHPAMPAETISTLLNDPDESVRRAAIANPSLAAAHRERWARERVARAQHSPYALTRAVAVASSGVSSTVARRRRHWQSVEWIERYAVAVGPATPLEILERLRHDGHVVVRAAAAARFGERP